MSIEKNRSERAKPQKEFISENIYELFNLEDLPEEERLAAQDALAAYRRSTNEEFRAGVAVVAEDGTRVAVHNEIAGPEGHAEMLAVAALYRTVSIRPESHRKLKLLALAASYPHEDIFNRTEPYGDDVSLTDIKNEAHWPCGRCLKFLTDYTANSEDVTILTFAPTGQVIRTSLRTLHPMPHRPNRVPLEPLQQGLPRSPDSFGK
jgi:cytidine deaminase